MLRPKEFLNSLIHHVVTLTVSIKNERKNTKTHLMEELADLQVFGLIGAFWARGLHFF